MDIIDNYDRLLLGQHQSIVAISKDEKLEDLDRQVKILSILSGLSEDEVLHLPIAEYKEMVRKSRFLEEPAVRLRPLGRHYQVGDFDLCPVTDYRKLETAQYVDFQTYAPQMDEHPVEFLSIILVPKGHRYNEGYDILEVQEALRKNMSVAEGATITAFFLTLCSKSIRDSLNTSRQEAKKIRDRKKREEVMGMIRQQERLLDGSGDGSGVSI